MEVRCTDESILAPYAVCSIVGGGRVHPGPADPFRGPFELDRQRIIACTAFRRLEHKTQVFAPTLHDHFRSRLTHTVEAAQTARVLAVALRANDALAEAVTLAHDLGHPPFGHAGEVALATLMADHGGFNHNAHSVRVVEYLEHPYPAFRGLNLTHETLAGMRTHETQYDRPDSDSSAVAGLTNPGPSVEARIASLADRIAYGCHDLEDAIGAEFVTITELQTLELWRRAQEQSVGSKATPQLHAVRRPLLDALGDSLLTDVVTTSAPRLATIRNPEQACVSPFALVTFSPAVETQLEALEKFLHQRVYRHPDVARTDAEGQAKIRALFEAYLRDPKRLPPRFASRIPDQGPHRVICDYLAGMTDRYCQALFENLEQT